MQNDLLDAQLDELDTGEWSFWNIFAGNGAHVAVLISAIIQVILGVLLFMEGDLLGTSILCVPTLLVLPIVIYLYVRRMKEARQNALTKATSKAELPALPSSGDASHEKNE